MTTGANAQNINTTPQWDGTSFISTWGVPNTATYGQTITSTSAQSRLSGFTFYLAQTGGTAPQYQAAVYQWDPVGQRITGSALYTSNVFTAPSGSGFSPVTINTGGVALTPGQQYVLFLTTSTITGQSTGTYKWGSVNNSAYNGNQNQFVYFNNGTNFAQLSSAKWSTIAQDLAFQAFLSGGNTGENHAQAQSGAFELGKSYLSLLTDPFATNKVSTTGTLNYAGEKPVPAAARSAFAAYMKAPPMVYVPHWDVWGAAFGGVNNTRGEVAAGNSDLYTRVGGVAAGADYRFAPDALIGFSLAGGNINWSVTPTVAGAGLGGGASDTFMAGVYGKYGIGPGYLSAAATYTNYWMNTSRSSAAGAGDLFTSSFNAEGWGGRIEGGYRVGQYWNVNWTPYGAIQGQAFRTPNYSEVAAVGTPGLALDVAGRTATAYRGEIGLRTDKVMPVDNGGQLNLFGKFAYAHDEISNPAATLGFVSLGGVGASPFTVFGARPSTDLALTTAGAEWRLANGVSFLVKFDGEFGDRSETYMGTGRIRYTW